MKKITLFILLLVFAQYSFGQIINEPANWPNSDWTTYGNYGAAGLLADPATDSSFSFDDDANEQNYYRLKLFSSCIKSWYDASGNLIEGERFRGDAWFFSNDPSFPAGVPFEGYTFEGSNVVFTDALFYF